MIALRHVTSFLIVGLSFSVLAGCSAVESDVSGAGRPAMGAEILRRVARSIRVGRIYDRSIVAIRDGNEVALNATSIELSAIANETAAGRLAALRQAEAWVVEAGPLHAYAQQNNNKAARQRATLLYRQALRWSPNFPSDNPMLLNEVGYFLADWGQSLADFQLAEKLTRRSLQLMSSPSWSLRLDDAATDTQNNARKAFEMANVRDSLAWSLFRQKRFEEAAGEQEKALSESAKALSQAKSSIVAGALSAELPFHLGEIYRAQNKTEAARQQYEAALRLEADHAASRQALRSLNDVSGSSR